MRRSLHELVVDEDDQGQGQGQGQSQEDNEEDDGITIIDLANLIDSTFTSHDTEETGENIDQDDIQKEGHLKHHLIILM